MNTFRRYTLGLLAVAGLALSVAAPSAAPKSDPSDLLTSKQVIDLSASAKTPAQHVKLQKYYLALGVQYNADATTHANLAEAERNNPNPGSHFPGSATLRAEHCDRLSQLARESAKVAGDLASDHEKMAAAK